MDVTHGLAKRLRIPGRWVTRGAHSAGRKPGCTLKRFFMLGVAGLVLAGVVTGGCENPCKDEIDDLTGRVMRFIHDTDPTEFGEQRCDVNPNSENYDHICDFAMRALSTRWPYYDCTSCDALEIKLCGCYNDYVWVVDSEGQPIYPAVVYCLATYYRLREMCACDPNFDYDENTGCYDETGERVCAEPLSPQIRRPTLQQTDICDSLMKPFACYHYDSDGDGIPDQYDGGQDRASLNEAEDAECLDGPPCAPNLDCDPSLPSWKEWLENPKTLYEGSRIFIDADGTADDLDNDGVSNSCDNCPSEPNGFDCEMEIQEEKVFLDRCDVNGDGVLGYVCWKSTGSDSGWVFNEGEFCRNGSLALDELSMGDQRDTDGDGVGDACDGDLDGDGVGNNIDNCPLDANPDQLNTDEDNEFGSDGFGDACDPDDDGDGYCDPFERADEYNDCTGTDNCPKDYNPSQADSDRDNIGNACDPD